MKAIARVAVTAPLAAFLIAASVPKFGPHDLEGRWRQDGTDVVLDVAPCGSHFCAILIKQDKTCGANIMTMAPLQPLDPDREDMALDGRLDWPGEPHPYDDTLVQADFDDQGRPAMDIWAHDKAHVEMRNYAFEARLMRVGSALCRVPSS